MKLEQKEVVKYVNSNIRSYFLLILLCLFVPGIYAHSAGGEVTFRASAPDVVVVGEQFRLSYVVDTQDVRNFQAPAMPGFSILMGPSQSRSSNMSMINGKVSRSSTITYTYILKANRKGTFKLDPASIESGGQSIESNSLVIKVLPPDVTNTAKNGTTQSNASASAGSAQQNTVNSSGQVSNKDLFIQASVSRKQMVEQEAFLLTYKIYSTVDLRTFDNVKMPDFKGFHSQEVPTNQTPSWSREHYNGRNYNTMTYRQFVLFPQETGKLTIAPARFDAVIAQQIASSDPFDSFFNGGRVVSKKKTLYTPKITVNVKNLPTRPADYSGAVGQHFSLSSSISTESLKTNEAVTVTLKLSGTGNMKLMTNPEIKFPEDFETYDPQIKDNFSLTVNGLKGTRTIDCLAIPRYAGDFTIPAVSFTYFDTQSNRYQTITSEPYTIHVKKGKGSASAPVMGNDFSGKEDLKVLGQDIRFIHRGEVSQQEENDIWYGTMSYWSTYAILLCLLIVTLFVYQQRISERADTNKMRTKRANKIAIKRLKNAGKLRTSDKKEAFYDELLSGLWGYTSDKLNIPLSELNKDNVSGKLSSVHVNEQTIQRFLNLLSECEFARFAPSASGENRVDALYSEALDVIGAMENAIK